MYAKLLFAFLFTCQIIVNGSPVTRGNGVSVGRIKPSARLPATLPEGYVTFPDDHAAYKIHNESATWDEARERCIAEGARLAITDSIDKVTHINSLKHNWGIEWLHVGIYKSNTSEQWVRVDNKFPLTFIPWGDGNPKGGNRNCAGISFVADVLVDYPCHWGGEFFVCEIRV